MLRSTRLSAGWIWIAAILIAVLVLPPQPGEYGSVDSFTSLVIPANPRVWIQLFANIALYIPLGFIISSRGVNPIIVGVIGAALSLLTELAQLRIPGRDPRAADVIANTVGTVVGAFVATTSAGNLLGRLLGHLEDAARRLISPSARTAHALAAGWTAVVIAVVAVTAWLLSPWPPGDRIYSVPGPSIDDFDGLLRVGVGEPAKRSFHGLIDEVLVFSQARSTEQVRADMQGSAAAPSTLAGRPDVSYTFDVGSGTSAHDDSGHGHDAGVHGGSWSEWGRHGSALALGDGDEARAMVRGIDAATGITVEAWVLPEHETAGSAAVVTLGHGAFTLYLGRDGNQLRPAVIGLFDNTDDATNPAPPIPFGAWTHLAATYDNQSLRLFVNGDNVRTNRRWSPHRPESVVINGRLIRFGRVENQAHLDASLSGNLDLRATVVCGPPADGAAPVFRVLASGNVNVFNLLARGEDLLIRPSTVAQRLGLASPDHQVRRLFRNCEPGRRLQIVMGGHQKRPHVARDGEPVAVRSPGLGSGWAFLVHSEMLPTTAQVAGTVIWLAALVFPAGLWMRPTLLGAVIMTVFAGVLFGGPAAVGLPLLTMRELGAAVVGLTAGIVSSRRARRLRSAPNEHGLDRLEDNGKLN